jgi:hypothetical protein
VRSSVSDKTSVKPNESLSVTMQSNSGVSPSLQAHRPRSRSPFLLRPAELRSSTLTPPPEPEPAPPRRPESKQKLGTYPFRVSVPMRSISPPPRVPARASLTRGELWEEKTRAEKRRSAVFQDRLMLEARLQRLSHEAQAAASSEDYLTQKKQDLVRLKRSCREENRRRHKVDCTQAVLIARTGEQRFIAKLQERSERLV